MLPRGPLRKLAHGNRAQTSAFDLLLRAPQPSLLSDLACAFAINDIGGLGPLSTHCSIRVHTQDSGCQTILRPAASMASIAAQASMAESVLVANVERIGCFVRALWMASIITSTARASSRSWVTI